MREHLPPSPNTEDASLQSQQSQSLASLTNDDIESADLFVGNGHFEAAPNGHIRGQLNPFEFRDRETSEDDNKSFDVRSETTFMQRRDLGILDVAALIINKQVGNGVFTTPGLVLSLTGSKSISIALWICGGVWAFLGIIIYVEFGCAFPFNGGELIYLDEVFRTPELLATILFSIFFVTGSNTDGNSLQFAKNVLLAASPDISHTTDLDKRLITLIAIVVLTFVSFVHYFSRNSGLFLNLSFAAYKIVLIIVLIIAGVIASSQPNNGKSDWGEQPIESKNVLGGLIYVMYAYEGWENANHVGGELKVSKQELKWGALLAVSTTTLLYILVTVAYFLACPFGDLVGQDLGVVSNFAPKAFGSAGATGIKICVVLSTFGNLIAVVYTSAKVKQQVARQCVIPFYKFFAREDTQFMTPVGALILHWVVSVTWIIATPNTSDGYGFFIGIFVYGQLVVGTFVGLAFFGLRRTYEADNTRGTMFSNGPAKWEPVILKSKIARHICALVFIGMNLMVLIESTRSAGSPPSWARAVIIAGLLVIGAIYWLVIWTIDRTSNDKSPLEIRIVKDGMDIEVESDRQLLQMAKLDGNSRVIVYEPHGMLKNILGTIEVFLHKAAKLIIGSRAGATRYG